VQEPDKGVIHFVPESKNFTWDLFGIS